jgi:hypothetical protein
MAKVGTRIEQHVDQLLERLFDAWNGLSRAETEIDRWDLEDQIAYVEEWGAKESLVDVLQNYLARGEMTESQAARLRELEDLIERNRAILDRLRAS